MDCAKFKLKEISYHITDGEHCSVQNSEDGGFYLLSNKNIIDGNIVFGEDERKISKETFDKINKRTKLSKGDLVISTVGTLGKLSIIKEIPNYDFQRSVGIIKPNCSVVDVEYLYYYMQQSHVQKKLTCGSSGAIQKCIFINQLKDFEVQLPSLSIQHRLASALSSFDKRIENLRAQNRVLEQTAKTIYDYTFLQCAGHQTTYNKTLNRNIPVGWEVKKIGEFFKLYDSKRVPLSKQQREKMKGQCPYYGATGVMDFVNDYLFDGDYILLAEDGSTSDGNGHPVVQLISGKNWVNNHAHIMLPNDPTDIYFGYYTLKCIPVKKIESGSIQKKISQENLLPFQIAVPDTTTMKSFNNQVTPLFKKQLVNTKQIESLTTQRNTLLPLLMTGQIEVV